MSPELGESHAYQHLYPFGSDGFCMRADTCCDFAGICDRSNEKESHHQEVGTQGSRDDGGSLSFLRPTLSDEPLPKGLSVVTLGLVVDVLNDGREMTNGHQVTDGREMMRAKLLLRLEYRGSAHVVILITSAIAGTSRFGLDRVRPVGQNCATGGRVVDQPGRQVITGPADCVFKGRASNESVDVEEVCGSQ